MLMQARRLDLKKTFLSTYDGRAIDTKGRIAVPKAIRNNGDLSGEFLICTSNRKRCIMVIPCDNPGVLGELAGDIASSIKRQLLPKLNIPEEFIDHLELKPNERLALPGCGGHFKIWSASNWKTEEAKFDFMEITNLLRGEERALKLPSSKGGSNRRPVQSPNTWGRISETTNTLT